MCFRNRCGSHNGEVQTKRAAFKLQTHGLGKFRVTSARTVIACVVLFCRTSCPRFERLCFPSDHLSLQFMMLSLRRCHSDGGCFVLAQEPGSIRQQKLFCL